MPGGPDDAIPTADPPKVGTHTFRCTAEEHAAIRKLASAAKQSMSAYLIACALGDDPLHAGPPPVGSEAEWREVLERACRIDACLTTLAEPPPGTGWSMFDGLAFLGRARRAMSPGARRWVRSGGAVRAERQRKCSLTCTALQWERAKARARRQGMSVSRFLVACGLGGAPTPVPGALHLRLRRIEDLIVGRDAEVVSLAEQMRGVVAFLAAATIERMLREGRADDMVAIAGELFGAETLARIRTLLTEHEKKAELP